MCFCLDVLEHIPNVAASLGEIKRVLNEDGVLIVSVPVESRILKIIREIYALGGRAADNDPHWHGDVADYQEFTTRYSNSFNVVHETYAPNRFIPYGIICVAKK